MEKNMQSQIFSIMPFLYKALREQETDLLNTLHPVDDWFMYIVGVRIGKAELIGDCYEIDIPIGKPLKYFKEALKLQLEIIKDEKVKPAFTRHILKSIKRVKESLESIPITESYLTGIVVENQAYKASFIDNN